MWERTGCGAPKRKLVAYAARNFSSSVRAHCEGCGHDACCARSDVETTVGNGGRVGKEARRQSRA